MIDKSRCDDGFIWNPSIYECELDKSCNVGEYLNYENCRCRKNTIEKLALECEDGILNAIPLSTANTISITDKLNYLKNNTQCHIKYINELHKIDYC